MSQPQQSDPDENGRAAKIKKNTIQNTFRLPVRRQTLISPIVKNHVGFWMIFASPWWNGSFCRTKVKPRKINLVNTERKKGTKGNKKQWPRHHRRVKPRDISMTLASAMTMIVIMWPKNKQAQEGYNPIRRVRRVRLELTNKGAKTCLNVKKC